MVLHQRSARGARSGFALVAAVSVASLAAACGTQSSGGVGAESGTPIGSSCGAPGGIVGVFWGGTEHLEEPIPSGDEGVGGNVWALLADDSIARLTDDRRSMDPSLSDDGRRLYFSRSPGGFGAGGIPTPEEAWIIHRDTGEASLLFAAHNVRGLRESPDGQRVAYTAYLPEDGANRVFTVELPGGEPVLFDPDPLLGFHLTQQDPVWSADGSRLAYILGSYDETAGTEYTQYHSVQIVDLRSGEHRQVYSAPPSATLSSLEWSADGRQLLVTESVNTVAKAVVVDVETGKAATVAEGVYQAVVFASTSPLTVAEIGVTYAESETIGAPPVLKTWREGNVRVNELPESVPLKFASDLMIPDCALGALEG